MAESRTFENEGQRAQPSRRGRIASRLVKFVVKRWKKDDPPAVVRRARRVFGIPNLLSFLYSRHVAIEWVDMPVCGEWLVPEGAVSDRVLLYFHGGGYVSCSPQTHRPITTTLARLTGYRVFALDYRLAPEHPFPAALDDATAAFLWLRESGVPAQKIALAGDSAGGGLVMATMLRLREHSHPLPAGAACLSPWVDLTGFGKYRDTDSCSMFTPDDVTTFAKLYLHGASAESPEASPIFADLSGLPPLLIQASSTELLLSDSVRLHEKATTCGLKSTLHVYPGLPHVWQILFGTVPEAKIALEEIARFCAESFDRRTVAATASSAAHDPVGEIEFAPVVSAHASYNDRERNQSRSTAMAKTLSRPSPSGSSALENSLTTEELTKINRYWRAANYLSVGQIYLRDNPLLREPLKLEHTKPRLLGHWGTTPGLNFIYAHMNRVIKKNDLNAIFIAGPGHGGPGVVANTYLEGSYTELYPTVTQDAAGMKKLFTQFSWPGGIPSHASPDTPGSIHEGGELGYSLLHAYGAVFDNPDLLACCVVGDGEAETGPCATSWHSNKFLNPERDGAVLPILHLNGYKIAGPTVLARIPQAELNDLLVGYGYKPYYVEGDDPEIMHGLMAATLDTVLAEIRDIQVKTRSNHFSVRPQWPMIVLRSPKGWTGPKTVDGLPVEGSFRSHQVPVADLATKPEHLKILEQWMLSYKPAQLFDADGRFLPELAALAPQGTRRMGANPHANGGLLLQELKMPDFRSYAVQVPQPGNSTEESTRVLGRFLRDVMKLNESNRNFRVMGPDETESNRLSALFEVTSRVSTAKIIASDVQISPDGRVMEVLSEHMCQGWLEGYLLTGRHGLFSSYEAFIQIVSSMFNQHAKWLESTLHIPWRKPIASLNYLLTSHVWRQDHNGFSHQDPGFLDHVMNKKSEIVRAYFPPDANCLLAVADECLRSRNYVNVIVAGKQPELQWQDMDAAIRHCAAGIGVWHWASNDGGGEPDAILACVGDVATLEVLAAASLLRKYLPDLRIRVINVVDLMTLQPASEHPHGLAEEDFDALFTTSRPVVFAYHGYPWLIHRLTYRRANHNNFHVRGFKEEGTTTTPFDMVVRNNMDRFQLAMDTVRRVARFKTAADPLIQFCESKLAEHQQYITLHGEDMPEVANWRWGKA